MNTDAAVPESLETWGKVLDRGIDFLTDYSFQLVGAVAILIAGFLVGRGVARLILRVAERRSLDVTLSRFLAGGTRIAIIVVAVIVALGKFGITITPFVAAIGAAAFGISFAIQGPVANYGAGLLILVTRPYLIGDTISVTGVTGLVDEVRLGTTTLVDEDGVKIFIPNKFIIGQILHNSKANRIVEGEIRIAYDTDVDEAVSIVRGVLDANEDVPDEPEPQVGIQVFAESAMLLGYRFWAPTDRYFATLYAVNRNIHAALQQAGVVVPFPRHHIEIENRASEPAA